MLDGNKVASVGISDADLLDIDLMGIEVVQTMGSVGLPDTGASCCPGSCYCSSCCVYPPSADDFVA